MIRFRRGEKAKVKEGMKVDEIFGHIIVTPSMLEEDYVVITDITMYGTIKAKGKKEFFYHDEMLEKVGEGNECDFAGQGLCDRSEEAELEQ